MRYTNLNNLIYYEEKIFKPTTNISAETIGTRGLQLSFSDSHPTDLILGIFISYIGDSSKYCPIVFYSNQNIYCNYYRTTTNAITPTEGEVHIFIIYKKN